MSGTFPLAVSLRLLRGTANNTFAAKSTSPTNDVSLLLWSGRCVTHARMVRPVLCNIRIARPPCVSHTIPHRCLPRQSSPTYCHSTQKATLCSRSELNFAVAIYPQDRSHAGRVCLRGSEQDSVATTASEFEHLSRTVVQGPETASQSVAVEGIPCSLGV